MKSIIKIILIVILLLSYTYSKAQQIQEPNLSTKIIGTWLAEDDPTQTLVFSMDGHLKIYFNNVLSSDYLYFITTQCKNQTLYANYDIFLKLIDTDDNEEYCELLNAIHTDENGVITLSITSERGQLELYIKQ